MNDFDARAAQWDDNPVKQECARVVAQAIMHCVAMRRQMCVLEYGCGTGLLGFQLQPYFDRLLLADSSAGMLDVLAAKIARERIGNMTPLNLDLTRDPLPSWHCDLVATLLTLHHVADIDPLLHAFYALLTRPGNLCIADLDREDGSFHGTGFSGHPGFDRAWLCDRVQQAGFRHVRICTAYRMPRYVGSTLRHFPLFLLVAEKQCELTRV